MISKHRAFIDNYLAEKDRHRQLTMMKDYMLSLPAVELTEFVLEPVRFFEKALKREELTPQQRKLLFSELEDMVALLQMKAAV